MPPKQLNAAAAAASSDAAAPDATGTVRQLSNGGRYLQGQSNWLACLDPPATPTSAPSSLATLPGTPP